MSATATTPPGPPTADRSVADGEPPEVRSWGWHLMQVSSWVLLVMLPIHLFATWLLHDSGTFGVASYADRWHSGLWRIFDWAFVVLALLHGGIGLNGVVGSAARSPRARTVVAVTIGVVLGVLGLAVSAAILSFDVV
jgi:succinate dehydrogenase hydrophobic anchor subunit